MRKKQQKKYLMQQLLTGKKRLPAFEDFWVREEDTCCFSPFGLLSNRIGESIRSLQWKYTTSYRESQCAKGEQGKTFHFEGHCSFAAS